MADLKISQLTSATIPLAGTEVLPIVQSNSTKKVASDDLTVKNVRSNATTGILQIAGPGAGTTRTMTTPNANFTAARTDAGQTFTGDQQVQTATSTTQVTLVADLDGGNDYSANYAFRRSGVAGGSRVVSKRNTATGGVGLKVQVTADNAAEVAGTYSDAVVVDNLGNATLSTGNLVQGTAAKGVNFTANTPAAGMTSQLLNWYEEGTWTPAQGAGLTVVGTFSSSGTYTRIGRLVFVQGSVSGATSVAIASAGVITTNLPYSAAADATGGAINAANDASSVIRISSATLTAATVIAATATITFSVVYSV